nr:MAG TPA_asm: hypothetical protein [Bacteriophage sp.]
MYSNPTGRYSISSTVIASTLYFRLIGQDNDSLYNALISAKRLTLILAF